MEEIEEQPKTRRQLQAEQTKDKLFAAAVDLLAEKAFEEIKIRDIVARAHVSIGTFYNYYTTKMEVFYETYRVADHYFSEVVAPALTQERVYDRILVFFDHYAHYNCDLTDMKMTRILYNTDNPFFNRDIHQGIVGVLIALLQEGLDRGELVGDDSAEDMAQYLMIAIRGLVYHWCTTGGDYNLTEAIRGFVTRLLRGYRGVV